MKAIFALRTGQKWFPILGYTVYRDGVFYATDCDMQIACRFLVPGLPDDTMLHRAWLKIVYEQGKKRLIYTDGKINGVAIPEGLPAEDMPSFPAFNGTAFTSVPIDDLRGVALAMGEQDRRNYLNGSWVDYGGKRIAATDGNRLHIVSELEVAGVTDGMSAIVPRDAIDMVIRCAGKDAISTIAYDSVAKLIQFDMGDTIITTKVIDGKFPDIDRVIPRVEDRANGKIVIQRTHGLVAMKRFAEFAKVAGQRISSAKFIHGNISNGTISVDSASIAVEGDITLGADASYMSDAVSFIGQESCKFLLGDPNASALAIHGPRTAIVMSLRV